MFLLAGQSLKIWGFYLKEQHKKYKGDSSGERDAGSSKSRYENRRGGTYCPKAGQSKKGQTRIKKGQRGTKHGQIGTKARTGMDKIGTCRDKTGTKNRPCFVPNGFVLSQFVHIQFLLVPVLSLPDYQGNNWLTPSPTRKN